MAETTYALPVSRESPHIGPWVTSVWLSVGSGQLPPLNKGRIVHLTDGPEDELEERFEPMAESPWLPEFVEIYLGDDLGV